MENIKKVSETEIAIEKIVKTVETYSLDNLSFQRDSLTRNKQENIETLTTANEVIDGLISDIEEKIAQAKKLGIKMQSEIEVIPTIEIEKEV